MATTTKRGLNKPDRTSLVNVITAINNNMDNLDDAVPDTRKINGKALSSDVTIDGTDLPILNTAIANTQAMIAPPFVEATPNAAGSYVTNAGVLYFLPNGHTANTTWANTSKTEVKAGSELTALNSAINVLEPPATSSDIGKTLKVKVVSNGKVSEYEFGTAGGVDPADIEQAVENYLYEHPVVVSAAGVVSVSDYGAVGDGETDDSSAIQRAVNDNYDVYFESNKTYYLASPVIIDHDCHLAGGENTVIKTSTPSGSYPDNAIEVRGTLKKTTTLTSDYTNSGNTACSGNRLKLTDMSGVNIGDIVEITATDQFYSYSRQYYYLGGVLLIVEKDNDYIYVSDALPFDIENTENVSVKVYSAPSAVIEDLKFVSDLDNPGHYKYCVLLDRCKNSIVRRCEMSNADNAIRFSYCVNTLVENIFMHDIAESGENTGEDHYGVVIFSNTNTTVERIMSSGGNCAISFGGQIPNINTWIHHCSLFAKNHTHGIDMHENAYNTVLEDCVLDCCIVYGTVSINRCRFVKNNVKNHTTAIYMRGSHNPDFAKIRISNTEIDGGLYVIIGCPIPQNPIQSFDNIIGLVDISNCKGGMLYYNPSTSATILSNRIEKLLIDKWSNCVEVYHTDGNVIDFLKITDSDFTGKYYLTKHTGSFYTDNIRFGRVANTFPQTDMVFVDETKGGKYYLKEGDVINFASSDTSAHYVICGENIQSNKVADYAVGSVTGSVGSAISRTVNNTFASAISVNASGELVFTQPSNSSTSVAVYPIAMQYVKTAGNAKTSCKIINTGETNGASFRIYIAIIDAETGLITYRNNGTSAEATAQGVVLTHSYDVPANSIVMAYIYCYSAVISSETTISEWVTKVMPNDDIKTLTFEPYIGDSRTGNGSLDALDGLNNIATNASSAASVKFISNLLRSASTMPSGTGVSF